MSDVHDGESESIGNAEAWDREKHKAYLVAINALADELAAQREENGRTESKKALRECVTIIVITLALVASVCGDFLIWRTINESQMEQRPWIGPPSQIETRIVSQKAISFEGTFENYGHSPPTSMWIDVQLVDNSQFSNAIASMCSNMRRRGFAPGDSYFTIIPGEKYRFKLEHTPSNKPSFLPFTLNSIESKKEPVIAGCIVYRFDATGSKIHQTGFSASIDSTNTGIVVKDIVGWQAD